jgi:AAA domain
MTPTKATTPSSVWLELVTPRDKPCDDGEIEFAPELPKVEPQEHGLLSIVTLEAFAGVDEPGAEAVLGTDDAPLIPKGGDVLIYGDGGVGKTTLVVDLAFHLAAGDDWLAIGVPHALRVLIVENEGPRPLFRKKLARKLNAWHGSPLEGRVHVFEHPWGGFTFADDDWQQRIAAVIREHEIDVLVVGPVTSAGMDEAGTIAQVRSFIDDNVAEVRRLSGRAIAIVLVHHENKGGKVSGAWEGVGDTLLHVMAQGHGKLRLYVQKARWSSEQHATMLHLVWADGDGFRLADEPPSRPERVWDDIAEYVLEHGGCSWNELDDNVGGNATYKRRRRDAMLEEGVLINAGTIKSFVLWHRDDPAHPILDEGASDEGRTWDAPASDTGDGAAETGASLRPSYRDAGVLDAPVEHVSRLDKEAEDTSAGSRAMS